MENLDFASIELNRQQAKLLNAIFSGETHHATSDALDHLIELGFVGWVIDDLYEHTPLGKSYLQYRKAAAKRDRKESVRYWITTAIAVAAFVLSVIALLLELGVIQAP